MGTGMETVRDAEDTESGEKDREDKDIETEKARETEKVGQGGEQGSKKDPQNREETETEQETELGRDRERDRQTKRKERREAESNRTWRWRTPRTGQGGPGVWGEWAAQAHLCPYQTCGDHQGGWCAPGWPNPEDPRLAPGAPARRPAAA